MVIDRAVVLQALKAMEANRYAVANQAPHGDVMAYNAAAEALRAAVLAQERAEPTPPPEAVTEAEKTAYAAGWWAAMAKGGSNLPPLRAEPKSLPCPAPRRCGEGCGGWCGPRAEAKA